MDYDKPITVWTWPRSFFVLGNCSSSEVWANLIKRHNFPGRNLINTSIVTPHKKIPLILCSERHLSYSFTQRHCLSSVVTICCCSKSDNYSFVKDHRYLFNWPYSLCVISQSANTEVDISTSGYLWHIINNIPHDAVEEPRKHIDINYHQHRAIMYVVSS